MHTSPKARRRDLLIAGGAAGLAPLAAGKARAAEGGFAIVADPADTLASAAPVQWAVRELQAALAQRGAGARLLARLSDAGEGETVILAGGATQADVAAALAAARVSVGAGVERLALAESRVGGRRVLVAAGGDARGLMYALLELADRVRAGEGVAQRRPLLEAPSTPVRSIMRQFVSEPLDKAWFNDRAMWPEYFRMLAKHRFNRLHLGFGLGYDTLRGVTDSYLLFLYPFLVDVPNYDVRVSNFSAEERRTNLDILRYISEQAVAHGVDFQLGIWTHGHALIDSPNARYHVSGLSPQNHANYCRDALGLLLRECPAISSVAIRFHGESGIVEGSYDFWQVVYQGVAQAGRPIEIDLHAKGVDEQMIARAASTGMPVCVSEKCWAEHHGMTYHQADIRPSERPAEGQVGRGLLTLSEGSLSFTRYGIADLMREGRSYTVRHRVFAGTQRILLSGDPVWAAKYAERFVFCDSNGMDLMEPLTARGRRGTGIRGTRRSGYVDGSLEPRWDWQKYEYWYRVWGRVSYNRATEPDVWRRHFGDAPDAAALTSALARASRILPIVTTAHMPSAACDAYWPEIYWNHSLIEEPAGNLYWDTPSPKDFLHATPHDPQLFTTIAEHADELLEGRWGGRYSPLEVAQWVDGLAEAVERDLASIGPQPTVDARRLVIDVRIQALLGRFFAAKFRAGVHYALFGRTGQAEAQTQAVAFYRDARTHWAALCEHAVVYADDLSVSDKYSERKHWREQLPLIDADIARVEAARASASHPRAAEAMAAALAAPRARAARLTHTPPRTFTPGQDVALSVSARGRALTGVKLLYRHVNQAERWSELPMQAQGRTYRASIPGAYTTGVYPLQYYFITSDAAADELYPGVGADLTDEPYFIVRRA